MSLNDTLFLSMLRQEAAQRQAQQDAASRADMTMLKDQRDQQLAEKIGLASRAAAVSPNEPTIEAAGGDYRVLPHAKAAFAEGEAGRAATAEGYRQKREMLGEQLGFKRDAEKNKAGMQDERLRSQAAMQEMGRALDLLQTGTAEEQHRARMDLQRLINEGKARAAAAGGGGGGSTMEENILKYLINANKPPPSPRMTGRSDARRKEALTMRIGALGLPPDKAAELEAILEEMSNSGSDYEEY
jgi:hypothetical protein